MATRNYGTGSIRQRSANGYSIRYYGLPDSDGRSEPKLPRKPLKEPRKLLNGCCAIAWPLLIQGIS